MMKQYFAIAICTLVAFSSFANRLCSEQKTIKAKIAVAAPQEDDYDVQYVKLDLSATNTSTFISGAATTVAKVVVPSMSDYYFELSNQLTIDSAKVNGQLVTVNQVAADVHKISLSSSLQQSTIFTVDVFYHGAPTGGTGFFTNGILNQSDNSIPVQVTHTVSAAVHSRDWFPCKQSLTDKIDSADIWVTVPSGLKVASNGVLKNVTPIGSNNNRFEWSSRYPVDYYLLSFAIAPYTEYNYYMHFTNSADSMLVQNYIYNSPSILQQHQDELDSIQHIINYFSSLFGRYPFDKEKFGICMTPLGGGMENQTMVSLGSLDISLIAHELSHQWWGDNVTCQSLQDMWLNEGFASYCEQLFFEHFYSSSVAQTKRSAVFNSVLASAGGSVYVDDTTQEGRIYDGRLTYNKGAAIAHMLRYMIHNDNQYFQILQTYQQQYKFKTATTEDLKNIAEQISGQDLDTFFHQWIYKEGYPAYNTKWAQNGNQVVIRISQTTSRPNAVSVFKIPIEIQLKSAQGDTVIRVLNDHNIQYYTFTWNKTMTGMAIDPNDHIINKAFAPVNDPTILDVPDVAGNKHVAIFPNPAHTCWTVKNLPLHSQLAVTDLNGRKAWTGNNTSDSIQIPSDHLAIGSYHLTISNGNKATSYLLMKQ